MTQIIENVGPDTRMITLVTKDAVYYAVEHLEDKEWFTIWSRTIPIMQDAAHRPGGPAFQFTAQLQASVAILAGQPGDA